MKFQTTPGLNGEPGYLALAKDIIENGQAIQDRTGVGTRSVFGRQIRFDLTDGFPLLTTKRVFTKAIVVELLWFLRGDTNVKFLHDHGITIWDEWADENGDLGPVYGKQWRSWPGAIKSDMFKGPLSAITQKGTVLKGPDENDCYHIAYHETIDQISNVMQSLAANPHSRRHIVSAWNPAEVEDMALPPCHCLFQFYVREIPMEIRSAKAMLPAAGGLDHNSSEIMDTHGVPRYYLDCQLYQRSADLFLGVPFNIASYALLTHMMAQQLNMIAGEFVHTFGDVHVYNNHIEAFAKQFENAKIGLYQKPTVHLAKAASLFDYTVDDVKFVNYDSHKPISAPVAK